jgi:predicted murein hydrolase (TIGR00659 family)
MTPDLYQVWVYLSTSPLLSLTLTLIAYQGGLWIYEKMDRRPLFNPVLIAVIFLAGLMLLTETDYKTYFAGAQFVHFLLGPATVALALPLYRQVAAVRRSLLAITVAVLAGGITAAGTAIGIAKLFGATERTLMSLAPKSVTAPVAMGISEQLGGLPSLTAVLVMLTGIIGAVMATYILNALRIKDWRARGFAAGVAAHGIGTARALQVNEIAGAFSGLAMGINALASAVLLPLLVRWLLG